jgi:hypothetical protein
VHAAASSLKSRERVYRTSADVKRPIVACDKAAKKFLYFDPWGPSETGTQAG